MAKHSHWDNIKHKKAAADYKKGAVIAKMGKLITVAVQMGGPNLADNPRLRLALEKARSAKMSNEAVDRAIKKAAGEAGAGKQMVELAYEGYAPGGVALVVECLTDNRNRTAPEIKKLFERGGGAVGNPGCVAWQFKDVAVFLVEKASEDAVLEALLAADCDAGDISAEDGNVAVVADPGQYDRIAKTLAAAKFTVVSAELTKLPENRVDVPADKVAAVQALIESLDDHDDVQTVHHNGDFP
jgi:YebC/PmpR family DNA-binding regulatory protein